MIHCCTRVSKSTPVTFPQVSPAWEFLSFLLQKLVTFISVSPFGVGHFGTNAIVSLGGSKAGIVSWSSMVSSRDGKARFFLFLHSPKMAVWINSLSDCPRTFKHEKNSIGPLVTAALLLKNFLFYFTYAIRNHDQPTS